MSNTSKDDDIDIIFKQYNRAMSQARNSYGHHAINVAEDAEKEAREAIQRLIEDAEQEGMRVAYMKSKFLIDDSLQPSADTRKIVRMRVALKMVADELGELQKKDNSNG